MTLIQRIGGSRFALALRDAAGWRPRPLPKVLGVGWAKTGTTTLGRCLHELGYRHESFRLDLIDRFCEGNIPVVMRKAARYESFEDWPWLLLYREFDHAFPGMKFILTVRDPFRWVRSLLNHIARRDAASEAMNRRRCVLYGLSFPDPDPAALIARYNRHISDVKEHFRDRPSDLLVVNWESGDGWAQLAPFLGHAIPTAPFPHANRGTYESPPAFTREGQT